MAQKVSVLLLCDLHADGDAEAQETISFAIGGTSYEIDVCAAHAQEIRDTLQPYVEHARRARGTGQRHRSRSISDRAHTAEIRAWAKQHGHQISERGRIPAAVVTEYEQNH